jgi:flagellar basal body rod protein FlgF
MTSGPGFKQLCNDVRHLSTQDSGDHGPTFVKLETSSTGLVHSNTETTGRALNSSIRIREDLIT